MSKIRKLLVATTTCTALVTSAPVLAQETEFSWTGFYVGGGLGMGSSNYDAGGSYSDRVPVPPVSIGLDLPDLGGEGFLGSLRAGYDYQVNETFVVGASFDAAFGKNIVNDTSLAVSGLGNIDYEISPSQTYTISARAGYVANTTTMLYGLLGYSRGTFEGDLSGSLVPAAAYDFDLDGITVGFGMETMLTDQVSLGIEYRRTDFERYSFYDGTLNGTDNAEIGFDSSVQSVQALVNYRF